MWIQACQVEAPSQPILRIARIAARHMKVEALIAARVDHDIEMLEARRRDGIGRETPGMKIDRAAARQRRSGTRPIERECDLRVGNVDSTRSAFQPRDQGMRSVIAALHPPDAGAAPQNLRPDQLDRVTGGRRHPVQEIAQGRGLWRATPHKSQTVDATNFQVLVSAQERLR